MQHLARASGVPLSLPMCAKAHYIRGIGASTVSLSSLRALPTLRGTFFEKRTLQGPLFYLVPRVR